MKGSAASKNCLCGKGIRMDNYMPGSIFVHTFPVFRCYRLAFYLAQRNGTVVKMKFEVCENEKCFQCRKLSDSKLCKLIQARQKRWWQKCTAGYNSVQLQLGVLGLGTKLHHSKWTDEWKSENSPDGSSEHWTARSTMAMNQDEVKRSKGIQPKQFRSETKGEKNACQTEIRIVWRQRKITWRDKRGEICWFLSFS